MHETTVKTSTSVTSHPGKDVEDALTRATRAMRQHMIDCATEWDAQHGSPDVANVRAHITALSTTTSTDERGWPTAHIVYAYELRATYKH